MAQEVEEVVDYLVTNGIIRREYFTRADDEAEQAAVASVRGS